LAGLPTAVIMSHPIENRYKTFLNPGKEVAEILNEWIGQPWKNWNSETSAIDWAQKQLPTMPRSEA
jgi:hypothetical protein